MRYIQDLSHETIHLLQKIYKKSHHHRVRQRAHCILLSYQGYSTTDLAKIFSVDRITLYNWFDSWESNRLPGLYDRKGRGRPPTFNSDEKTQIRQWAKQFPKNLNKVRVLIRNELDRDISKQTIKRVLKSAQFTWRRIRKKVKGRPDPELYQKRKTDLDSLIAQDREGIIDLRYFDESGFCLVPYIPYAWQENGETISIETARSKRLNVLGFMNKRNSAKVTLRGK